MLYLKRKQGLTIFFKVVVFLIGITVLTLCIFGLPEIASRDAEANPETAYLQYPFLVCAYVLSLKGKESYSAVNLCT